MIPRYARPMCGWPRDVEVCSHNLPVDVCDADHEADT